MIDNLELIKDLLNFENEGDFYMLYVLKRKKDQTTDKANHQSVRTIKTYCVNSISYLETRYDEIKELCEMFKARAYIHVQKQNHKDVSLNMMVELAQRIQSGQHTQQNLFDSVVGQLKTHEKRWIIDIDTKDEIVVHRTAHIINSVKPEGEDKIIKCIPTLNGYHLITKRFDVLAFNKTMESYGDVPDIQKKNPTLLYLPDSLHSPGYMTVSMDGLRKQLAYNLNNLTDKLNSSVKEDMIEIDPDKIRNSMEIIRGCVGTLLSMYKKGPDGFECLDIELENFLETEEE